MFREALDVTGVVLTKLDGTAKGGVILGIVEQHKVPVRFIGLGERVEDLREFDAQARSWRRCSPSPRRRRWRRERRCVTLAQH